MMTRFAAAAVAFAAVLFAGCQTTNTEPIPPITDVERALEGDTWVLTSLMGVEMPGNLEAGEPMTIRFDPLDHRFMGTTGCNTITGEYTIDPATNEISFFGIVSTMKKCPDMSAEATMIDALETTNTFLLRGHNLTLSRAQRSSMAQFISEGAID